MEEHFETFRREFPLVSVMVYDDSLVYNVAQGTSRDATKKANELIEKLNLPLVAINSILQTQNSFSIHSKIPSIT